MLQLQHTTVICGDFNARIGDRTPLLDHDHPPRFATDTYVCPRATWFITLCELHELYILNGIHSPAVYTCHTGRGESTVDYILCNYKHMQIRHTPLQQCNITDHDMQVVTIPLSRDPHATPNAGQPTSRDASPSTRPLAE